eukprot:CAMPEP_0202895510 /NCGR_PEP_ID=MMETSP1392-20130828/4692_1 /ASSEMBLY_ACC=CAM_ASM_000868 /TAXON_ID=225041 /ORGANISM="Chlamydomonas chlamydogama, Strain SAG 11-48b" /LENGTH=442 /DNA_ID=CAMNT_0049580535 /DNA_START=39 /DNA_END=1367 /DNA_ORIENTATION=-
MTSPRAAPHRSALQSSHTGLQPPAAQDAAATAAPAPWHGPSEAAEAAVRSVQGASPQDANHVPMDTDALGSKSPATRTTAPAGGWNSPAAAAAMLLDPKEEPGAAAAEAAAKAGPGSAVKKEDEQQQGEAVGGSKGTDGTAGAAGAGAPAVAEDPHQMKLVCSLEELDDSDSEERRKERVEKAATAAAALALGADPDDLPQRPRWSLWRTARERTAWLRDIRRAGLTLNVSLVAFCACVLSDRCQLLINGHQRQREVEKEARRKRAQGVDDGLGVVLGAGGGSNHHHGHHHHHHHHQQDSETESEEGVAQRAAGGAANGVQGSGAEEGTPVLRATMKRTRSSASTRGVAAAAAAAAAAAPVAVAGAADLLGGSSLACVSCGQEGGEVVACDGPGCQVLMHPSCAGLPGMPTDSWLCPTCSKPQRSGGTKKSREASGELLTKG